MIAFAGGAAFNVTTVATPATPISSAKYSLCLFGGSFVVEKWQMLGQVKVSENVP